MSEQTKTVGFDLDYQGDRYVSRQAVFGRNGDKLLVSLRAGMVEIDADEAEELGTNLIAAAEAMRAVKAVPERAS